MEIETVAIPTTKETRIANNSQIFWGTYLGGFLCGYYLIAQNYKALGYPQLAKKVLITALCSIVLFAAFVAFMVIGPNELNKPAVFFIHWGINCLGLLYLHYEHYKTLYNKNQLWRCLIGLPIIGFLLAAPLYLNPNSKVYIASLIFPLTAFLFYSFAKHYQGNHLKGLWETGIKKYSQRKIVGISAIALMLHVTIAFAVGFIIGFIAEII